MAVDAAKPQFHFGEHKINKGCYLSKLDASPNSSMPRWGHGMRLCMTALVDENVILRCAIQEMFSQHSSCRSSFWSILSQFCEIRGRARTMPLIGSDAHCDSVKQRCDAVIAAD
ncbi:uncharacterized protein TrAFT101_008731 [Trichoderma asperellum]|uniref:uncharacterized protein n=1 Tax=Trichoderma asperellum TaxID=101201 RepID=UPI00332932C1|nr:hypothetical protein TrAFT101_008731 [Trichoderma asperellum]